MSHLPTSLPDWYTVKSEGTSEKGWTPKTTDIVEGTGNPEVINAWNNSFNLQNSNSFTVRLNNLQVISPLQVGGGSFFEGGILPAEIVGVPCIPGSSIRGALLSWIKKKWDKLPADEQEFWSSLINQERSGWQPRKIRFENVFLQDLLKPYPLYSQQDWQIFNQKSNQLSVQWQVSPELPELPLDNSHQKVASPQAFARHKSKTSNSQSNGLYLQILLRDRSTSNKEKLWLETQLQEMLKEQGIGRGTASGFGRLATSVPTSGLWEIQLKGMKPGIQQGTYRWTPQVLRAILRGYFTRLALSLFSEDDAKLLTNKIFGSTKYVGRLILTSYLSKRLLPSNNLTQAYHQIWVIQVNTSWRSQTNSKVHVNELIGTLLPLASVLGGLGPGWRRPPHNLNGFKGYRGSEFTVQPNNSEEVYPISANNAKQKIGGLISRLKKMIQQLAKENGIPLKDSANVIGSIISIWKGKKNNWYNIVHGVCSSEAKARFDWCGNSQTRPSGYAVREHKDFCLITVFDRSVEATLEQHGFERIL